MRAIADELTGLRLVRAVCSVCRRGYLTGPPTDVPCMTRHCPGVVRRLVTPWPLLNWTEPTAEERKEQIVQHLKEQSCFTPSH